MKNLAIIPMESSQGRKDLTTFETFKKHPLLFLMGCLLSTIATFAVMGVAGYLIGLNAIETGRATAGVLLVSVIPGGYGFIRFIKRDRPDKSILELDSPKKRVIFLLAPVGLVLILASYLVHGYSYNGWFYDVLFDYDGWRYSHGSRLASLLIFWIGFLLLFSGLVFSFLYDKTIGKLVGWVKG